MILGLGLAGGAFRFSHTVPRRSTALGLALLGIVVLARWIGGTPTLTRRGSFHSGSA
ncbi:hypothetical protein [Leucobacter chromiiresistens]|uniref:hypothetical protein n=1 Tax=Leucobacter chromiiresistens TaxID=1079994 RepID=UPI0015A2D1AB|nr:hypothetical protein [Leucobacter chromiiresistens]